MPIEKFAQQKINPGSSSILEESLELVPTEGKENQYADIYTGEIFYGIRKYPEVQRFVSLLFKGYLNTADIVQYKGRYYSHKQKIENLQDEGNRESLAAGDLILEAVFGDTDRLLNNNFDELSGAGYHYDFDRVWSNFAKPRYNFLPDSDQPEHVLRIRSLVNQKAKQLLETVFNGNSEIFHSIIERSNIVLDDDTFKGYHFKNKEIELKEKQLYEEIRERLSKVIQITT